MFDLDRRCPSAISPLSRTSGSGVSTGSANWRLASFRGEQCHFLFGVSVDGHVSVSVLLITICMSVVYSFLPICFLFFSRHKKKCSLRSFAGVGGTGTFFV